MQPSTVKPSFGQNGPGHRTGAPGLRAGFFPLLLCVALLLVACRRPQEITTEPLPAAQLFAAGELDNAVIQFIWLELPAAIEPGPADARLFAAAADPPQPLIPNSNDLRCLLARPADTATLGPARIPFEFGQDGSFSGRYSYPACPACVECYQNWDYTLTFDGQLGDQVVLLEISVRHFGLNVQDSYLTVELAPAERPDQEPRMTCNQSLECRDLVYVSREVVHQRR